MSLEYTLLQSSLHDWLKAVFYLAFCYVLLIVYVRGINSMNENLFKNFIQVLKSVLIDELVSILTPFLVQQVDFR